MIRNPANVPVDLLPSIGVVNMEELFMLGSSSFAKANLNHVAGTGSIDPGSDVVIATNVGTINDGFYICIGIATGG